jgi:ParB family chromosome partitioning protein
MHTIPIPEIDPTALIRDRSDLDPAALAALTTSIAAEGLRMPIEVWSLSTHRIQPDGPPHRYGLISGLRRLTACRSLGHSTIPAFLRTPDTIATAMAAMISENEHRADISAWEKGRILLYAQGEGHFDTLDAAALALYPHSPRPTRARYRAFATVVEALDGLLTTPESLSTARMERLAAALRGGNESRLCTALSHVAGEPLETQWQALQPALTDTMRNPDDPDPTKTRPRPFLNLKQGLRITREQCRNGWILRFTGPQAKGGGLIDDLLDQIEYWCQPRE